MKTKLIYFSDQQINRIQKDSNEKEISFTEMVRRIIDQHYDDRFSYTFSKDTTFNLFSVGPTVSLNNDNLFIDPGPMILDKTSL